MSNDRDAHESAVGFAGLQVEGVIAALGEAHALASDAHGTVINAVGASPDNEHGVNAAAWMIAVVDTIEEQMGMCHNIIAELNQYGAPL